MLFCPKVSNPCPEEEVDKMTCSHCGFYMDAKTSEIHGYCFDPDKIDTCDYQRPDGETR